MMYLDTHVVIWLYEGAIEKLSERGKLLLNTEELRISPIVRLELQFLQEINRIRTKPDDILDELCHQMGIGFYEENMRRVIHHSMDLSWTRDPFDRLILSTSLCH